MYSFSEIHNYSKGLNILYIEDDIDMLHSSCDIFQNYFSRVDTAINGLEGLEKYRSFKKESSQYYDLIITDINMPLMNGIEMIKHIKKINPKQTVIVISAYNDSDKLITLIREGISNFITKPIVSNQLLQILYKVSQTINNEKLKNEFLISQSKLAAMGEMVDTIAHQWLGPINLIKMHTEILEMDIEDGIFEKENILECAEKQSIQIEHLLETLKEFRSFFRPTETLTACQYTDLLNGTLILLKDKLILHTINIEINVAQNIKINILPNEFKHVLINIINNAVYAFKDKKIKTPKLVMNAHNEESTTVLEIIDNAGGIPTDIIEHIFQENFTTKEENGTGVGLHLVKLILEKINAKIEVENVEDGAKFSIRLNKI